MARVKYDYCVGTADPKFKRQLTAMLSTAGFYAIGSATSIPELLRKLRAIQPWLVVVDINLPPGNLEQLASIIEDDGLAAAIYLGTPSPGLRRFPHLPWPVEERVLTAVAQTVCLEFSRKKKLRQDLDKLKQQMRERREIEKAKLVIMQKSGADEEEAYRLIRSRSMRQRIPLIEAARQVLEENTGK
ncbi:MAG TPA: ANTAR domain-containing protein [Bacillota bacterium]|nr:ANTAR domain-containing protein [Bacillota bacterium]